MKSFESPLVTVERLRQAGFSLSKHPGARSVLVRYGREPVALWRPSTNQSTGVLTILNPSYITQLVM